MNGRQGLEGASRSSSGEQKMTMTRERQGSVGATNKTGMQCRLEAGWAGIGFWGERVGHGMGARTNLDCDP